VNDINPPHKLILFDMDGTLVHIPFVYRHSVRHALQTVYGLQLEGQLDPLVHRGNTQPNIFRAIGRMMGLSSDVIEARLPEAIRAQSAAAISAMDHDLQGAILPGVLPMLERLGAAGHALGLVTGTVSAITSVVLERTGLARYFPVCACGDEGEERVDLLRLAIKRAQQTYGLEPVVDGLVVVGDAVRDIEAGKALGARVVAVATGAHPADALAEHSPDAVLPSFEDVDRALDAILGPGR